MDRSQLSPTVLSLAFFTFFVLQRLCNWLTRVSISSLPGPSKSSWLFGNLLDLSFEEVGVPHLSWQKDHGTAFKIYGLAGVSPTYLP